MNVFWAQFVVSIANTLAVVLLVYFGRELPSAELAALCGILTQASSNMKPWLESKAAERITTARLERAVKASMYPPAPPPQGDDA